MRKIIFLLVLLSFTQTDYLIAQNFEKVTLDAGPKRNNNSSQDYDISANSRPAKSKEQQLNEVKHFFDKYGMMILIAISGIGLLAFLNKNNANQQPLNSPTIKKANPISNKSDIYSELEKLAALKEKGVISEDEFNKLKASILAKS